MADKEWKVQSDRQASAPSKSVWSNLLVIIALLIGFCLLISLFSGNFELLEVLGLALQALSVIFRVL